MNKNINDDLLFIMGVTDHFSAHEETLLCR